MLIITTADDTLNFFVFVVLEKKGLGISCESSAHELPRLRFSENNNNNNNNNNKDCPLLQFYIAL